MLVLRSLGLMLRRRRRVSIKNIQELSMYYKGFERTILYLKGINQNVDIFHD